MTDSTGPAETPGGVVPGGDAARRPASGQDPEGSKAQYLQLFSRELGIFARCRSAIADGTWESCRPQIEAELPLIKRYAGAAASPILGAATAVIDLTDYVIKRDSRTSLEAAAHALTRSTVAIPDPAAAARWLAASGNDLADVLPPATGQDAAVAALFGLWAAALRGDLPAEKDAVPVPALVSHQYDATVGSVCVRRLESGPGGFFPDPESIALTAFDGRFREAVRRAWQSRPMPGATVLWSVVTDNNDAFSGDSVGAALALALDELDRRAARLGRLKLRRANDRYIISAALDTNETLRGVDELDVKFDAASAAGKNVVLAELDRAQGDVEAARTSVHVDYARNLSAAIATTRRTNPLFVVICVATVILLTGLSLIGVAADHAVAAADRQAYASKLLNKVDELQNLASKAGNGTVPDRQTQALLLLAAHSLALQAGRRDIANNIVDGSVTAGAGVITSVNADLGNIHGMYAYGGDVVTTSEKGKIALIDGTTDDVLGTYTNPPGTETLNQPIVTAFAAAPHADMFAAVFQVPIPTAPVSRTATLRIFSGASRLSLVGSSVPFTARPVSAIGYSPGGDRLITVSPSTATYWDTTEPTPRIIGSCRLASPGRAAPAALLDDPKTHLPVLVESDSRVMALSSWDVTGAGQPCAESQLAGRWIGGVATPGFDAPAVTAGTTSTGGIVIAARTAGGRVGVRDLSSGRVRMLPLKARATGIGNPGQSLAVQAIGAGGRNILSQWNMADLSKPTLTATYAHHSLPAVFSDSSAFATTGGDIVDALNDQAITYPAGFVDLGPNIASNGTAAGERSFAVDYQGSIAVYTLSASRQGQFITTPAGFGLSDGDYRADSTFTISDDGRYVAAIMNVGGGSKAASPRHVFIWDVKTGTGMSVPAVLAPKAPYHRPLDIRFIPHSDDLLVNYLDGSLYRLSSDGTGWHASLIRRPTANTYNFGMDVGPGGIYLIQVPGPGSSQGSREVLRLSYTGAVLRRWNFTSLQLTAPLLAPLLDGGSLLIDSGGDAYRLHPNGIVGPGVDLSVQAALEAAQTWNADRPDLHARLREGIRSCSRHRRARQFACRFPVRPHRHIRPYPRWQVPCCIGRAEYNDGAGCSHPQGQDRIFVPDGWPGNDCVRMGCLRWWRHTLPQALFRRGCRPR